MDSALEQSARRRRRRPPLKSYVPFFVFATGCLALLIALCWLVAHLLLLTSHGSAASPVAKAPVTATRSPEPTHHRILASVPLPTATQAGIGSMMAVGSAQPTLTTVPTSTPVIKRTTPRPTATSAVSLVIARSVKGETPVEKSNRFVSPALRLWVVAKIKNVHATDVLRFVFQRNGVTLPHDDITVVAGHTMGKHTYLPVQSFKAWADYQHGAKPLPSGNYRVLFYRNKRLEGQTAFRVG